MIALKEGEHIILEVRRHWYRFLSEVGVLLIIAFIPLFLLVGLLSVDAFSRSEYMLLYLFFGAAWLLFVWVAFFIAWTDHYLDVWVITELRIADIEQHGLFHRDISECLIANIEDVRIEVKGLLATVFKFGDIHVQTAGESREFVLRCIPDPQAVKEKLVELQTGRAAAKSA